MDMDLHSHRDETDTFRQQASPARGAPPIKRQGPAKGGHHALCGSGWYHDAAIEVERATAIEARCNPYEAHR